MNFKEGDVVLHGIGHIGGDSEHMQLTLLTRNQQPAPLRRALPPRAQLHKDARGRRRLRLRVDSLAWVTISGRSSDSGSYAINRCKHRPPELLRSAKTILIRSDTMFLKSNQLEAELRKRPEFTAMGLVLVRDMKAADLIIDLDRPVFTYTFTFSVTNPETSVLVTNGQVIAFDGNLAAPKIAREVLNRFRASRDASEK